MAVFKILFLCLATFMVKASAQIQSDQIRYEITDGTIPDVFPLPAGNGVVPPNPLSDALEDLLTHFHPGFLALAHRTARPARGRVPKILPRNGNYAQLITIGNGNPETTGQIPLLAVQQAFAVQQAKEYDQAIANRLAQLRNGRQVNWIVHATITAPGNKLGPHISHNIEI